MIGYLIYLIYLIDYHTLLTNSSTSAYCPPPPKPEEASL